VKCAVCAKASSSNEHYATLEERCNLDDRMRPRSSSTRADPAPAVIVAVLAGEPHETIAHETSPIRYETNRSRCHSCSHASAAALAAAAA